MTPELDLSSWPSKPEAAKLFGISERTLDRMVKLKAYPEVRLRARKGLKPEPVVNPDDVARMIEDLSSWPSKGKRAVVMPRETALQLRPPADDSAGIARMLGALATVVLPSLEAAKDKERLWLNLKQASEYSGFSMALLQRAASRGLIEAVKDNGWKIRRAALYSLDREKVLTLEGL